MNAGINLDAVIAMYFKEHGARARERYDRLFEMPDEKGSSDTCDASPVAETVSARTKDEESEQSQIRERILDVIGSPYPKPIMTMLEGEYKQTNPEVWSELDSALELVENDEGWRLDTRLEVAINYLRPTAATHMLHALHPQFVFPLDFEQRYKDLKDTFGLLGIKFQDDTDDAELLPVDIVENISEAVEEFRAKRGLEPWQVWALVYDLAPRLLPQPGPYPAGPVGIWLTGAGPENFALVDNMNPSSAGTWPMNRRAKRGDIALMYCRSPRSAIGVVLRLAYDAYSDPLVTCWGRYWTVITDGLQLPQLTLQEMRADPVLKHWHMVRTNFQGLTKVPVPSEIWNRMKLLIAQKNAEIGRALERYETAPSASGTADLDERQFENRILLPILERLGWRTGENLQREFEM